MARRLGLFQPDFLHVHLEGLMDAVVLHLGAHVTVELLPKRLDDDARILENRLQILHDVLALGRIADRQRFLELGVEGRIGISALVPGFPPAILRLISALISAALRWRWSNGLRM